MRECLQKYHLLYQLSAISGASSNSQNGLLAQLKFLGIAPMGVKFHLKVELTVTPKNSNPLLGDTKSHFKFKLNMICGFGAI